MCIRDSNRTLMLKLRGIERVIVNGEVVRESDSYTAARAGTIV